MVGEDVVLKVVDIRGDRVRIGIEAPKSMRVDRGEIRSKKDRDLAKGGDDVSDS
jgi:carbon storage regulator